MIDNVINKINDELTHTFREVDDWFSTDENLLHYDPKDGGWSIVKVLEHISLTNHFLLILIRKGTRKSIELSKRQACSGLLVDYDLDWEKLDEVGKPELFKWNRPEHMEPTGTADLKDVRNTLNTQVEECRMYLQQLKNGEGILYKTMMTVNGIGKIDVYHYIYFLIKHANRHLRQMERIKTEFENK